MSSFNKMNSLAMYYVCIFDIRRIGNMGQRQKKGKKGYTINQIISSIFFFLLLLIMFDHRVWVFDGDVYIKKNSRFYSYTEYNNNTMTDAHAGWVA